ncbi:MAG: DinB family protein [bacterium]
MKFDLSKSLEILQSTPYVLEKQLCNLSNEWLIQNEGEGTWNSVEIICHLIHCEKEDWIARMKIILNDKGNKKFEPFNRTKGFEKSKVETITELVDEFKKLREENLDYLRSQMLTENDLDKTGIHPDFGEVTLKQLLATWVVHDLSHIAQINRVLAKQYTDEVGQWKEYLPILKK